MNDFAKVNDGLRLVLLEPFPARATVQVARLPKDARVEIDAIATSSIDRSSPARSTPSTPSTPLSDLMHALEVFHVG
jgi:hypothetical protein